MPLPGGGGGFFGAFYYLLLDAGPAPLPPRRFPPAARYEFAGWEDRSAAERRFSVRGTRVEDPPVLGGSFSAVSRPFSASEYSAIGL